MDYTRARDFSGSQHSKCTNSTKLGRLSKYLSRPQFSLAMLLILLAFCGVIFGIVVNRANCHAEVTVLCFGGRIDNRLVSSPPFMLNVLTHSDVRNLSTIRPRSNPDQWLRSRLAITHFEAPIIGPFESTNGNGYTITLEGNTYRDRTEDFVPILQAVVSEMIDTFESPTRPEKRLAVISEPTLIYK